MGRGNFYKEGARTIYVEIPEFNENEKYDDWIQELKENIRGCLPESFQRTAYQWSRYHHELYIANNKLFACFLADNEHSIAVSLMPHPETEHPELAKAQLLRVADAFFDRLSEHYQLHVRNTAWTSSHRTPAKSV